MTTPAHTATTAADYSKSYYGHYSSPLEPYSWQTPRWREWFTMVARQMIATVGPVRRSLDVGCAIGLLVQALANEGVDAQGFDISDVSIADADPQVADRLWVASATEPIEGRYDLVTCIEVLEHMAPADALSAIDRICSVTDKVVLSTTPGDFDEPTHVNVHPTADWVAAFSARGFYRRTDADLGFLTPWAVLLERGELTTPALVHRYESMLSPLRSELIEKRRALLDARRQLDQYEEGGEITQLRHELMRYRDHAIGCEAEAGTARAVANAVIGERDAARAEAAAQAAATAAVQAQVEQLSRDLEAARAEVAAIHESERWRLGGVVTRPAAAWRRRRTGR